MDYRITDSLFYLLCERIDKTVSMSRSITMPEVIICIVGTFLLFSFIHYAAKKKKPFLRAFLSMLLGVGALTLMNLLSGLTGVYIPVTKLSLLTSAVAGVPGVALLALLTVF